jgi:hypothetical protein
MGGQWYDANISIPGCDKNMPGVIMAMGRVNRPSLMVYGGTIKPGCAATQNNADIDIVSAFQLTVNLSRVRLAKSNGLTSSKCLPWRRSVRWHVHREYYGHRNRSHGHVTTRILIEPSGVKGKTS